VSETTRNFPKEIKDLKATLRHGRGRLGREWLDVLRAELKSVKRDYKKNNEHIWQNK